MKVLFLDAYNLIHRARHSLPRGSGGEYPIVYSFFRSLRPIIEKFAPDKAYFVLEGRPKRRLELAPDYKATRVRHDDDGFQKQKGKIIELVKEYFPMTAVRHEDYECDDVLANLIRYKHATDECTVVSSDTDFFQLYNHHTNVKVYNPIRKMMMPEPEYNYVTWKALRGDSADNIPGFKGIGTKRATMLTLNEDARRQFLSRDDSFVQIFEKNQELIRFHDMKSEMENLRYWEGRGLWTEVRKAFDDMKFFSITNDKSWQKFVNTFACLN